MEPTFKDIKEVSGTVAMDAAKTEIQAAQPFSSEDDVRKLIHKLNNHLTIVIGHGQFLVLGDQNPEIKEDITRIIGEAMEVSKIVQDLRSLVISEGIMKS